MRRTLALLVAAAALAPAAATADAAPRDCSPARGEKVVARSDGAVVLRDRIKRQTVFTACATDSGKRSRLGAASSGARRDRAVGPFAVSGPWVAWGTASAEGGRLEAADLHVRDARRPRSVREAVLPYDLPAREVAVDAAGRVAALTEIQALVLDGERLRSVDAGARGTLSGLRLEGGDATWSHGSQVQRAPLDLPLGDCAPEAGAFGVVDGPRAVLAQRNSGRADSARIEIIACVRDAGGGFFPIGEERGQLAGTVGAALLPQAAGGYAVGAVDLATRAAIGAPVPIAREFDPWALAGDGTIVVLDGRALVAHLPDGRTVPVAPDAAGTPFVLVDDLLGTVVWDRGSAPLPR